MRQKIKSRGSLPLTAKEKREWQSFEENDHRKCPNKSMSALRDPTTPHDGRDIDRILKKAATAGQEKSIELFLESSHLLNAQASDGATPLVFAVEQGWIKLVSKLLQMGADPRISNRSKKNAFTVAVENKDFSIISLLLRFWEKTNKLKGIEEEFMDDRGYNLLMMAVENEWLSGAEYFLNISSVEHQTPLGETALILASKKGNATFVQLLFEYGGNLLHESKLKMTAICYSIANKHQSVTKYFYQNIDEKTKQAYLRGRLLYLCGGLEGNEDLTFLKNTIFQVILDIRKNMPDGAALLLQMSIFQKLIFCGQRHFSQTEFLQSLLQFLACLLYDKADYSKYVDVQYVEQFISSRGINFLVKVLQRCDKDSSLRCNAILPFHAIMEVDEGKDWIRRNSKMLLPFLVNFNKRGHQIVFKTEGQEIKASVLWKRFKETFQSLTQIDIESVVVEKKPASAKKTTGEISSPCKSVFKNATANGTIFLGPQNGAVIPKQVFNEIVCEPPLTIPPLNKTEDFIFDPYTGYNIGPASQISDCEDDFQVVTSKKMKQKLKKKEKRTSLENFEKAPKKKNPKQEKKSAKSKLTRSLDEGNKMDFEETSIHDDRVKIPAGPEKDMQQEDSMSCHDSDGIFSSESVAHVASTPLPSCMSTSQTDASVIESPVSATDKRGEMPMQNCDILNAKVPTFHPSDIMLQIISGMFRSLIKGHDKCDPPGSGLADGFAKGESEKTIDTKRAFENSSFESMEVIYHENLEVDREEMDSSWEPKNKRRNEQLKRLAFDGSCSRKHLGQFFYSEEFPLAVAESKRNYLGLNSEGREVVIKQISYNSLDQANIAGTIQNLKECSLSHKNILPFLRSFLTDSHLYLINDLCEFNLSEYLHILNLKSFFDISKNLVAQVLNGLCFLHERPRPIVHGRLKPSNILIDSQGQIILSDFALVSLFPPLEGIIRDSPPDLVEDLAWRPRECICASSQEEARQVYTPASDMQVAGMVAHFIMTGGKHPFGKSCLECQLNILNNNPSIDNLGAEGQDLVNSLIGSDPCDRLSARTASKHPLFLYPEQKVHFLATALRQPEFELSYGAELSPERFVASVRFEDAEIHPAVVAGITNGWPFEKTALDLICLILNCIKRFDGLLFDSQVFQSTPAVFYIEKYPQLLLAVYKIVLASSWRFRKDFEDYF